MIPQEIIDAAPDEPETLLKFRKEFAKSGRNYIEASITLALEPFGKITFQFGPTLYTVWNTKQNLELLNKRLKANKKLFPKS